MSAHNFEYSVGLKPYCVPPACAWQPVTEAGIETEVGLAEIEAGAEVTLTVERLDAEEPVRVIGTSDPFGKKQYLQD